MANAQRGESSLKIGDKTYTLQYGWNAIASIGTVTGLTVEEVGRRITKKSFHGDVFRAVVWGMLRKHHPEIDLVAVGDLMDEVDDPATLGAAVAEAMVRSTISEKGKTENPPPASP